MAISSDYDLQIAELEAQGIERGAQQYKSFGGSISGSMSNALQSAEILQKRAIESQKDKEVKVLLAKGAEGINQYSRELGFDERTTKMFGNMAGQVKDPSGFMQIYSLQKAKSDKDISEQNRIQLMNEISSDMAKLNESYDPKLAAQIGNKVNSFKTKTTDKDTLKQLESIEKGVNSFIERGKSGTGGDIKDKDIWIAEDRMKKDFDNITKSKRESIEFVDKAINLGKAALNQPEKVNTAADIALIMSFNKILDPGSVVREGEYDRVEKAQGVLNWVKGFINSMTESGGAKLTDKARKNLINAMESMKKLSELTIIEQGGDALSTASSRGLRLRSVAGSVVRKNPEDAELMVKAFSDTATQKDKQAWQDRRTELLNEAFNYAAIAANAQGDKSNYQGENMIDKVSSDLGINRTTQKRTIVNESMSIEDMLNTLPEE